MAERLHGLLVCCVRSTKSSHSTASPDHRRGRVHIQLRSGRITLRWRWPGLKTVAAQPSHRTRDRQRFKNGDPPGPSCVNSTAGTARKCCGGQRRLRASKLLEYVVSGRLFQLRDRSQAHIVVSSTQHASANIMLRGRECMHCSSEACMRCKGVCDDTRHDVCTCTHLNHVTMSTPLASPCTYARTHI